MALSAPRGTAVLSRVELRWARGVSLSRECLSSVVPSRSEGVGRPFTAQKSAQKSRGTQPFAPLCLLTPRDGVALSV